jgi:lysophospholipase L1-like esterase
VSGVILVEGDSIALGLNLQPTQVYGWIASHSFNTQYAYYNEAAGGDTSANVISRLSSDETIINKFTGPNVYTVGIGANDINTSVPVATIYSNIQSICASVKANTNAEVIVETVLPGNFPIGNPTFENNRQLLNTDIRNGGSCPYIVSDRGNDSTIGQAGDQNNTTYYQVDGMHPTSDGDSIIETGYFRPALISAGIGP